MARAAACEHVGCHASRPPISGWRKGSLLKVIHNIVVICCFLLNSLFSPKMHCTDYFSLHIHVWLLESWNTLKMSLFNLNRTKYYACLCPFLCIYIISDTNSSPHTSGCYRIVFACWKMIPHEFLSSASACISEMCKNAIEFTSLDLSIVTHSCKTA